MHEPIAAMNVLPYFSVIIPTCGRNDLLATCLNHLAPASQTLSADHYEVIVTDDGSTTTAEQMIKERYGWATWVAGPCKGPAANRNNGAKYARGEWLVFIDDDCIPDKQWLDAYAKALASNTSISVLEGRTYVNQRRSSLAQLAPINETGGNLWSCNFALKKRTFESLAGFDERFPYAAMEDMDFRTRLLKSGYQFYFIREASVCHPWRERGDWKSMKRSQESYLIYLSLHPEEMTGKTVFHNLRATLSLLVKDTLPGIVKFRGRGAWKALMVHIENVECALLLSKRFARLLNSRNETKKQVR